MRSGCSWRLWRGRVSLDADAVQREILATRQYAGATRISHYDDARHPTKSAVIMTIENGVKRFYRQMDP